MIECEDFTDPFSEYTGNAHTWRVTIDLPASVTAQQTNGPYVNMFTQAGCCQAGDPCNPLRTTVPQELLDQLNKLKPAHTVIHPEYIWN